MSVASLKDVTASGAWSAGLEISGSEATAQSTETLFVTCQYHYPKCLLSLVPKDNQWMKLNPEFISTVDTIVIKSQTPEVASAPEKLDDDIASYLTNWGVCFPTQLKIGAELYSIAEKRVETEV
jgi:hypothetical protein